MARVAPPAPADPPDLALSEAPTIKGKQGAVDWYRTALGIPVSMNNVVVSTNNHTLPSYLIGGAVYYSTRDLYRHVTRNRRTA